MWLLLTCWPTCLYGAKEEEKKTMSKYLHFISQSRLPQGYMYFTRVGFPTGFIGSEHVPVVLPPTDDSSGHCGLVPWYSVPRADWLNKTSHGIVEATQVQNLSNICKIGRQTWNQCAFRWSHFMFQHQKMEAVMFNFNKAIISKLLI